MSVLRGADGIDAITYLGLGQNHKTLLVVAKQCGINKNVTWHQSRHSYATTICLSNGVPIETLSKMMGHTSIRSTQIYAKITAEKVSNDMEYHEKNYQNRRARLRAHGGQPAGRGVDDPRRDSRRVQPPCRHLATA